MKYTNVCLESWGYTLPDEVVTSAELETRLRPLYERLRLPEGRLELMTGIRERRFWTPGTLPSEKSIESGRKAIEASGIDPAEIGALIHASVCRDYLEPATACGVHRGLGLRHDCLIYDVSNACLGVLNGIVQVANMIELGQIRAGLVVGAESGRALVENTIELLNTDTSLTREQLKFAIASLTIGSGSVAVLVVDRHFSRTQNRLVAAAARTNTEHYQLCHGVRDADSPDNMQMLMQTDSERLLHEGVATGVQTFAAFLDEVGWSREELHKVFCHQVGVAHRKLMFQGLGLTPGIDFSSVEWLGNTGAVAAPLTMALGIEAGHLAPGDHVALLGIGSGINSLMLGIDWQKSPATLKNAEPAHDRVPKPAGRKTTQISERI